MKDLEIFWGHFGCGQKLNVNVTVFNACMYIKLIIQIYSLLEFTISRKYFNLEITEFSKLEKFSFSRWMIFENYCFLVSDKRNSDLLSNTLVYQKRLSKQTTQINTQHKYHIICMESKYE